jgi:ATP-dependent DNA ligase
MPVWLFRISF